MTPDPNDAMNSAEGRSDAQPIMVALQFGGRTVKGYAHKEHWPREDEVGVEVTSTILRPLGATADQKVSLAGVKAVFFVKSFEGKWHNDLRFHDHLPAQECLWVRVTFVDGEVIEGLIRNHSNYVVNSGFYMLPTDPEGNNWLIYVLKNKLKNLQVLGLRSAPRTMRCLHPPHPAPEPQLQPR
jgi:hypothetical protein